MRSLLRRLVLMLLVVLVLGVALEATASADGRAIHYRGSLLGYRGSSIDLKVTRSDGHNVRARFQAEGVELVCDDGSFPATDMLPRRFDFVASDVFEGQRYASSASGDWSYYEVKGRLLGARRASGYLYFIDDPYDPPGTENRPECSTGGQLYLYWTAKRVR
jgi:hypothetical protein